MPIGYLNLLNNKRRISDSVTGAVSVCKDSKFGKFEMSKGFLDL